MSSMAGSSMMNGRILVRALALAGLLAPAAVQAADGSEWDRARAQLAASQPSNMAYAIDRWKLLASSNRFNFTDYAGFLMAYPGLPDEDKLRRYAEDALSREYVDPARLVPFFDRFPPLTNPGRAQYAQALSTLGRPEAESVARAAWRGGPMSDAAEAVLFSRFASRLTADDQDARMDALLWAGARSQAERQLGFVSPARRGIEAARLAVLSGVEPGPPSVASSPALLADPGYLFQRVRQYRRGGDGATARSLLASAPRLSRVPMDQEKWIEELLVNARAAAQAGDTRTAVRIASRVDEALAPGTDVSKLSYGLRDDYTSLVWLGGTLALWRRGDGAIAAPLFYRYGAAAKTPQTRSKGFYWAGLAASQANDGINARRYLEQAATYADHFYGQLALERLGRAIPQFAAAPAAQPTQAQRQAFLARPIAYAVREVARASDWRTAIKFFREIAEQAQSESDHLLVAELARNLGRRDLAVIVAQSAGSKGLLNFQQIGFPTMPVPASHAGSWTMIHAITRQESQFAQNAVSHAGARGLMQLMPGTAREQAGKIGLSYAPEALMTDPSYNIQLGSSYISRMLRYYNGSYPLAVAAYNAGPGNVNKWLRSNGDPRTGAIGWVDWIERIPLSETRNYVHRVIENAVVYEAMHPERASFRGPNPTSRFLGKATPG